MTEQNNIVTMCRNGHQQKASDSKFCIYCGTPVSKLTFQASQHTAQNNFPPPAAASQSPPPQFNSPRANYNQNFQMPPLPAQQAPFIQPLPPPQMLPPPQVQQQPAQVIRQLECYTCGGDGHRLLSEKTIICKDCNWLRPLAPGYRVDPSAFEWAADGKAMSALRAIKPLNAVAQSVSEKVGRRWIETTFNGVLLGEKQLPQIYGQAVRAARLLGMSHMPDVYISGERAWDCLTFGSHKDSFVVIGSALAGNFQGADMLFLLAREMGHCLAGHALWKTVIRFFLGEQGPGKGMMAGGIFNAILNPAALIEGALEVPLLAWARQAEITADRAGLLAVGSEEVARRVLLSWTLKSSMLYRQINLEAWLEQQAADEDDSYAKLSELTTTSTPYITPRLKLLAEFAKSQELIYWRKMIADSIGQSAPKTPPPPAPAAKSAVKTDVIKLKCGACQTVMSIPQKALAGKNELPVKCPNAQCGKVTRLKKKLQPAAAAAVKAVNAPKQKLNEENMNYGD